MKIYNTEREGQLDFFEKYNINFENNENEEILKESTDGIYHGCILEFKLNINDLKSLHDSFKTICESDSTTTLIDLLKKIKYESNNLKFEEYC